jgi:hypothetical protein
MITTLNSLETSSQIGYNSPMNLPPFIYGVTNKFELYHIEVNMWEVDISFAGATIQKPLPVNYHMIEKEK